ncbi:MAG: hypothetical protein WCI31_17045 [Prolixibacteraceae bacterium]
MKRLFIYRILTVLVIAAVLFAACTKGTSDVKLAQKLSTSQFSNVTSSTATVVGFVVASGDGIKEKGVCYNTEATPTITNSKVAFTGTTTTATYNVNLSGLAYATTYYARAYATGLDGTFYGEEVTFTTLPVLSTVTTTAISAITGNAATGGGNVTVSGGAEITARGICYSNTNLTPTVADTKTSDSKGTGAFISALTGLKGNTTYNVRAYAINSVGTSYGAVVSFKTLVDLPVVTTTDATAVTKTGAASGGNVTYDGGGTISAKGLAWSTSANPTISGTKIDGGTGLGAFVSNLTGLVKNTVYHVRAYATNTAGTSYGSDIQFTTVADITKFWIVGDYNGWGNNDNAKFIISTLTSNGDAEGYVYLKSGGFKLATDHSWSDPATFGIASTGKLTNPGGNIPVPADGYYYLKANLGAMTYTLTQMNWGIIGNATPGGWGSDTPMSYDPTKGVWSVYASLIKQSPPNDGLKFRGNGTWDYNYGDNGADGSLESGGTNIGVATTNDYLVVLDLSVPNTYTYSMTTWGLIGDATPGGWGADTPLKWDATKKVWTANVVLIGSKQFKFRANQGWTLNYGGKGTGDGAADNYTTSNAAPLKTDGKNLGVPNGADGTYTVTFDPVSLVATVTKI